MAPGNGTTAFRLPGNPACTTLPCGTEPPWGDDSTGNSVTSTDLTPLGTTLTTARSASKVVGTRRVLWAVGTLSRMAS
ncbi:MAG: hypothetical protein R2818_04230 [Flavobacteriales bacterium]